MAGASAPILTPQDYHHLGLEHYEGLGIILVNCWPQVKLLSFNNHQPCQAHPPRSAAVRNGCGFQLNLLTKSMVIKVHLQVPPKAIYTFAPLGLQFLARTLMSTQHGVSYMAYKEFLWSLRSTALSVMHS